MHFSAIMNFFIVLSLLQGGYGYLRANNDPFGCSGGSGDSSCIKPDLIPMPQKVNPATLMTSVNDSGFVTAESIDGDDGTDGDPGAPPEKEVDPAQKYMIVAPVMEAPPPMPPLIICRSPEECTTTTTTLPPGASR